MQYVGIDWAYRRAAWCALGDGGAISGEGVVPADEDGLARLVLTVGPEVRACVEMISGAAWVRDRMAAAGWEVAVAHARKVRDIAPLACKTDKVDARVLAELCRRDLVPALWLPSLHSLKRLRSLEPRTFGKPASLSRSRPSRRQSGRSRRFADEPRRAERPARAHPCPGTSAPLTTPDTRRCLSRK